MRVKSLTPFLISILLGFTACKEAQYSTNAVETGSKLKLEIYDSYWFAKAVKVRSGMFGHVFLVIKGKTNAERMTVKTYGDGIRSNYPIKIDSAGMFNDTIPISFTHFSGVLELPLGVPRQETRLYAYLGEEWTAKTFSSGDLMYTE